MAKENTTPLLYTSILYICGLVLFLEWLYPVKAIAEINNLQIFIVFTIYCFLLSLLQLRWWVTAPLKLAGIIFIIHLLYLNVPFMSNMWFELLYWEISYNFQAIFSQNWYSLSSFFRSVLFLLIIWIMSYLIHYWFYVMKRFFLFILLTFVYVTIIDTFTLYDAHFSIIRIFIVSFVALGIANFLKELHNESMNFTWIKKSPTWIIPIIMVVLLTSIVGYAAPKYEPQWPDPVPFIKGVVERTNDSDDDRDIIKKVGYGEDDSRLGGSFVQDYSVVFQATAAKSHYWRVETKDVYTGKGWEQLDKSDLIKQDNGQISLVNFTDAVETERLKTTVSFQSSQVLDRLVYPYIPIQVEELAGADLFLDTATEAIHTQSNGGKISLGAYTLTYDHPLFDIDALKSIKVEDQSVIEQYTQLPESLPDRVHDLAEEITAPYTNIYDQALAVERYFRQNDYVYQIDDVPVPKKDEDYVDQFLFDTKAGYCDNYSTSMVVLLRSVGIPARWAKGFTGGTKIGENIASNGEDLNYYEVTNANAHSWVEVYFEDIGWVSFEPTRGFTNYTEYADSSQEDDHELIEDEHDEENVEDPEIDNPEIPQPEEETGASDSEASEKTDSWLNAKYMIIGIGSILLLIIMAIIYKTRHRWRTRMISRKLHKKENVETFEEAYHYLLHILANRGIMKQPDQTLREYANHIDQRFMTTEMRVLTKHYEEFIYNNEPNRKIEHELLEVWENLMKRVIT